MRMQAAPLRFWSWFKEGKPPTRRWKVRRALWRIGFWSPTRPLYLLLGMTVLLLLKVIRPLVNVRIWMLHYERIGHLALNTETFLRRNGGRKANRREVFLFVSGQPANRQLLTMIKRRLRVIESPFALRLFRVNRDEPLLPWIRNSPVWSRFPASHEFIPLSHLPPALSFTPDEEARGKELLAEIGVGERTSYVCFHARDRAYLNAADAMKPPNGGWSYHNYRDCNVSTFLLAVEYLTSKGILALRMGSVVERPLDNVPPGVVDYASSSRTDFADVYLVSRCKFFLGASAGLDAIALIFNVPVVVTNHIPISSNGLSARDLWIPKKLWSTERKRFLAFREIAASGIGRWMRSEQYAKAGVEVVDNAPEEILDVVKEMDQRLEGTWVAPEEDAELQSRFWARFPSGYFAARPIACVGAAFLRQNRDLLE